MEEHFNAISCLMATRITNDLNTKQNDVLGYVLDAYNRYQDDERDGADHIFNILNTGDLRYMVDGGLTAEEIAWAYNKYNDEGISPLFFFGQNYTHIKSVGTYEDLKRNLISWLPDFIPYVIMYVTRCTEYQNLYEHYITEYLEQKNFG